MKALNGHCCELGLGVVFHSVPQTHHEPGDYCDRSNSIETGKPYSSDKYARKDWEM